MSYAPKDEMIARVALEANVSKQAVEDVLNAYEYVLMMVFKERGAVKVLDFFLLERANYKTYTRVDAENKARIMADWLAYGRDVVLKFGAPYNVAEILSQVEADVARENAVEQLIAIERGRIDDFIPRLCPSAKLVNVGDFFRMPSSAVWQWKGFKV